MSKSSSRRLIINFINFKIMLKLNLIVYDSNGQVVEGLSVENAAPQQIQAVLMFLKSEWRFVVECSKTEPVIKKS